MREQEKNHDARKKDEKREKKTGGSLRDVAPTKTRDISKDTKDKI